MASKSSKLANLFNHDIVGQFRHVPPTVASRPGSACPISRAKTGASYTPSYPLETLAEAVAKIDAGFAELIGPQEALAALDAKKPELVEVDEIGLRPLLGEPYWQIRYREPGGEKVALVHARDGVRRGELSAEEAQAVAERDFAADVPVRSVERVESSEPAGEYRAKPLPAWRVAFEHPTNTRIYTKQRPAE